MKTQLALLLLAATPALAQSARPLREAKTVPLAPTPEERLVAEAARLSKELPLTRKLVPPTRGTVKLGILLVELADCPRPAWGKEAFAEMLFSKEQYVRDPSGQPAFGSVHDYYTEQSAGALDLEGKVFDWVSIPAKRKEIEARFWFSPGAKREVLNAAVDRLLAREGAHALDEFDALGFIVSGGSAQKYGTVLWPHSDALLYRGKVWRYYLTHAGEKAFEPIGVHAHEIGHVLGLPDEYGLGHRAGSGIYCLMAIGNGGGWDSRVPENAPPESTQDAWKELVHDQLQELLDDLFKKHAPPLPRARAPEQGSELFCLQLNAPPMTAARPLHICAPCKAALGWVKPIGLAPGQRVFLDAVEDHPGDVVAIPLRGSERLVLEYRGRHGFDAGMPRSGLLAWKTGDLVGTSWRTTALAANGELVPAHGVASVDAAHREGVMWPWKSRTSIELEGVKVDAIEEKDGRAYFTVEGR